MLIPLAVSVWRFNTRLKKVQQRMDKNNRKLKILYNSIAACSSWWKYEKLNRWMKSIEKGLSDQPRGYNFNCVTNYLLGHVLLQMILLLLRIHFTGANLIWRHSDCRISDDFIEGCCAVSLYHSIMWPINRTTTRWSQWHWACHPDIHQLVSVSHSLGLVARENPSH